MRHFVSLMFALKNFLLKIDSEARLRTIARRQAYEIKNLKRNLSRCETDNSELRHKNVDIDREVKKRDIEIALHKLQIDGLSLINERNNQRIKSELAAATVQSISVATGRDKKG